MRASNVEAHGGNRGHEKDTRIVRSGIMELFEDPVPLLHAMVPVQQLHLDSGVAKDLEGKILCHEHPYHIVNLTLRMTSLFEGNAE